MWIGNVEVTETSAPYMIAEIGINHNGDLQIAKKLIDAANACGWHAVKFQKRVPDIAVPEAQKQVMRSTPWGEMTYLEYKKKVEFEKPEYDYIDRYCAEKPIAWSASPWDVPSLEFLLQYNIPFLKIASATFTNDELLMKAAKSDKVLIVSTGMSNWEEIDHAVDIIERHSSKGYVLMHTNSVYPAKHSDLNLRVIQSMRDRYHCLVGYSGHEQDLDPTVVAVGLGARVIERHVTLSHEMWGTDQKASLTVAAMSMLAGRVGEIHDMMGDGERVMKEAEMEARKRLRGN